MSVEYVDRFFSVLMDISDIGRSEIVRTITMTSLERHEVSNHLSFDCLFNSLCEPT